jgi:tRNA pseudouridine(38-40) synthase
MLEQSCDGSFILMRRISELSKNQLVELIALLLEQSTAGDGNPGIVRSYIHSLDSGIDVGGNSIKKPADAELIAEVLDVSVPTKEILKGTIDPCAASGDGDKPSTGNVTDSRKRKHVFDINAYHQRQLAFQIEYDGGNYLGFASQEDGSTVEHHLFEAFTKLKLIEDRKSCSYSRCGRTDKGVSALGQIISLRVRSANHKGYEASNSISPEKIVPEIDYCAMLNRCLPSDIRAIGCTPVTEDFSARFSAAYRTYRYFFLRQSLDITAMQRAADYLVGTHDFRNLCKMDISNVTNFKREIFSAQIVLFCSSNGTTTDVGAALSEDVFMMEIKGIAFLWHMVRCIMSVLFMVGQGLETPDVVQRLLDIHQYPRKPSYMMAPDLPLVLHECGFDNLTIRSDAGNLWKLTAHYRSLLEKHVLCAAKARNVLDWLQTRPVLADDVTRWKDRLLVQHKLKLKSVVITDRTSDNSTSESSQLSTAEEEDFKRIHGSAIAAVPEEEESCLPWRDVLHHMSTIYGLWPQEKFVPYVPLMKVGGYSSYWLVLGAVDQSHVYRP